MANRVVQRTQTGVRIETSLLKVLKGLAEYTNLSLGDLLEGIVLHSFEGKAPHASSYRAAQICLRLHAHSGGQPPTGGTPLKGDSG
jgi:predicted DNA-binding ribbon-helix-helix protein